MRLAALSDILGKSNGRERGWCAGRWEAARPRFTPEVVEVVRKAYIIASDTGVGKYETLGTSPMFEHNLYVECWDRISTSG